MRPRLTRISSIRPISRDSLSLLYVVVLTKGRTELKYSDVDITGNPASYYNTSNTVSLYGIFQNRITREIGSVQRAPRSEIFTHPSSSVILTSSLRC